MATYRAANESEWSWIQREVYSQFPIVQSVIDRTQQGAVFVSEVGDCWVLHKAGFSQLFLKRDDGRKWIDFIVSDKQLPNYFHLHDPDKDFVKLLEARSDVFNLRHRERIQLTYKTGAHQESPLPQGFKIQNVTEENFASLSDFKLDLEKKFWNSKEEFIARALGAVVVEEKNGKAASLCYAASIASGRAEIDVVTLEPFRGKGLAKFAVKQFIRNCGSEIRPNWDCFRENRQSLNVALGLGFQESKSYTLISLFVK